MKHFRLLVILMAVTVAFMSCDKDEDEVASVSGNKYETTYYKIEMTGSATLTVELKTKAEIVDAEMYQVIEFRADGKFYADGEQSGTWTQSGSKVTVIDDVESNTATLSGNVLTISMTETDGEDTTKLTMKFTKI